jgi:hypothetical protein
MFVTGDGVATVRKTEYMHCDSSPTDVSVGVVHLLKIPCAAVPQLLACRHGLWMYTYCLWGLSLVACYMAVSVGCMQSVWAPAIAWYSLDHMWKALFSSRMMQSVCLILVHGCYSIWHYSLHHLYCYVIWSPEAGVCDRQQRHITSLEDACDLQLFTWDVVGCLHCVHAWFPIDTNWMVTPCLVTHHSVSQVHIFITVLLQVFQWFDVWCFLCLMSWVALGATQMTPCDIQDPVWWHAQCLLIWRSIDKARIVQCLSLHVTLDVCSVLWMNDSVRLFVSWCVCHSLLAHSEHSEPVHSFRLWYTSGTMHLAISVSSLTSFHSKKLNCHPLVMFGWTQRPIWHLQPLLHCVATHPVNCIVVHTFVCASVFSESDSSCAIYAARATLWMSFSCASYVDQPLPE